MGWAPLFYNKKHENMKAKSIATDVMNNVSLQFRDRNLEFMTSSGCIVYMHV